MNRSSNNEEPSPDEQLTDNKLNGGEYLRAAYNPPEKEVPYYAQYIDRAESGLRAVKLIVTAGMTAFVILAIYGYYLIYQLTDDAAKMAQNMQVMTENMQVMTVNVAQMNQSTMHMADSVNRMQNSTANMDNAFTTPMNEFNSFMPWGRAPRHNSSMPNNQYNHP
jgi:hypothetical protein